MVASRRSRVRVEIKVRKLQLSKNQVSLKRVTGEKKLFDADNPYQMYVAWIVKHDSGYLILIHQYLIYFFFLFKSLKPFAVSSKGRFSFVRTDRPGHSRRNENFSFNQSNPDQSNAK